MFVNTGMFRVWREKFASEATYLRLAEGLEKLKLRNIIINLLDLYSERSRSVRQAQLVETSIPRLGKCQIDQHGKCQIDQYT